MLVVTRNDSFLSSFYYNKLRINSRTDRISRHRGMIKVKMDQIYPPSMMIKLLKKCIIENGTRMERL